MDKFKKVRLNNGLTILHEKRDISVSTVMLGVKFGSMYESADEKGIAHFMEHLCFKGTEKRSTDDIAKELEGVGGELNAFTDEEMTAYHVRLPSKHLKLAIDVIGDIFFNPIFPKEEIVRESGVICEEIKMYKDNPRAHTLMGIKENLYRDSYGMSIAGTEETVKSMTRDQLIAKHRSIYIPKNSVLCVVGNNEFDDVVKFAEEFLSIKRDGEEIGDLNVKTLINQSKENRQGVAQANLCLGAHFPRLTEGTRYAAEVFVSVLGGGMSSRLFKEVREKRGLVYGVKSDLDVGRNYGYMVIWAGCDPKNKDQVIKICKEEFAKMADLTEEELKEAKERVIGKGIVDEEGSNNMAVNLISEEFARRAEDVYEYEKNIEEVALEDIKSLANNSQWAEFWVGP